MPVPYQLSLTQEQEAELVHARDHAQEPYLRLFDLPRTRWWLAGVRQVIP
jgi:hypothetical protein